MKHDIDALFFRKWQSLLGYNNQQAADALGVSLSIIEKRRSGESPLSNETRLAMKGLIQ